MGKNSKKNCKNEEKNFEEFFQNLLKIKKNFLKNKKIFLRLSALYYVQCARFRGGSQQLHKILQVQRAMVRKLKKNFQKIFLNFRLIVSPRIWMLNVILGLLGLE